MSALGILQMFDSEKRQNYDAGKIKHLLYPAEWGGCHFCWQDTKKGTLADYDYIWGERNYSFMKRPFFFFFPAWNYFGTLITFGCFTAQGEMRNEMFTEPLRTLTSQRHFVQSVLHFLSVSLSLINSYYLEIKVCFVCFLQCQSDPVIVVC